MAEPAIAAAVMVKLAPGDDQGEHKLVTIETVAEAKRPRRGEIWRRRSDGLGVRVEARRTVNPMEPVRPHSDMRWSLVIWTTEGGEAFGCDHESDFLDGFEFVEREGADRG